jgi:hypothetical protein
MLVVYGGLVVENIVSVHGDVWEITIDHAISCTSFKLVNSMVIFDLAMARSSPVPAVKFD